MPGARRPLLLAALSALLFGASVPLSKPLLQDFGPLTLSGLLYLGSALLSAPLAWSQPHGLRKVMHLNPANRRRLAGAVVLGGCVGPLLMLVALGISSGGTVSLLLNLEIAFTALLGVFLFREHLSRGGWSGLLLVMAGAALLGGLGGLPGWIAALLTAGACLAWSFDNHWTALVDGVSPEATTAVKGVVAGIVNLSLGFSFEARTGGLAEVGAALAIGALCYGASIILYVRAAQQTGATRAQAVFASSPFLGAALAVIVAGETLTLLQGLAAALFGAGLIFLLRGRHGHDHLHEAMEHAHEHRHNDGHHGHEHPGQAPCLVHSHVHRHAPTRHAHSHWPDLHHRHDHREHDRKPT